jgi:hypothetical protein
MEPLRGTELGMVSFPRVAADAATLGYEIEPLRGKSGATPASRFQFAESLRLRFTEPLSQASKARQVMTTMQSVVFKPWICEESYQRGFAPLYVPDHSIAEVTPKRTLIVSESYFNRSSEEAPFDSERTKALVSNYVNSTWKGRAMNFFTNITNAFLGGTGHPSDEKKRRFWNSVAHYVFVQKVVGTKPRQRPTEEMWLGSQQPFLEAIEELRPQLIIILGYATWRYLPCSEPGPLIDGAKRKATYKYQMSDGNFALAYGIEHPSSGKFSPRYWHPFIINALKLA